MILSEIKGDTVGSKGCVATPDAFRLNLSLDNHRLSYVYILTT